MKPLFLYLLIINAAGFLLMLADKHYARKKRYRIPEVVLFGAAIVGGSLGCLLGMHTAHHKTKKPYFSVGIPMILIIQVATVIYFYR